jgi:hypothetical protein
MYFKQILSLALLSAMLMPILAAMPIATDATTRMILLYLLAQQPVTSLTPLTGILFLVLLLLISMESTVH